MRVAIGFFWIGIGSSGGACEQSNGPSKSMKAGHFLISRTRMALLQEGSSFMLKNNGHNMSKKYYERCTVVLFVISS
jgi:hypothetical protein